MLKTIATIMIVILIISNIGGNHAKQEKHVADFLIISRISNFILLTVSIIHLIIRFPKFWWLNLLWIIYLILIDMLLETTFRLKRETFGSPHRSHLLTAALIIALIIVIIWL